MASAISANSGASRTRPSAATTTSKARFSAQLQPRQRRASQPEPGVEPELHEPGVLEAVEQGLAAEMDFGRRAQERVDAGLDHVGPRPGQREIDVVGSQHAHGGGGEREIVGERGRAVAQRQRRGDLHAVGARFDPRRVARQRVLEADDDDAARRDPAGALGALDPGDDQAAGGEQRQQAGDIEDADRAARIERAGAGGEAERQRAEKGDVPGRQAAGELAAAPHVNVEPILTALDRDRDDDHANDQPDRRRRLDFRQAAERQETIERGRAGGGGEDRQRVGERRRIGETGDKAGEAASRSPHGFAGRRARRRRRQRRP